MNWGQYFNGGQMEMILFSLSSIVLFVLACQAALLVRVLLLTKQRWYHFFSLALVGMLTAWLYQNFIQAQGQLQYLWNHELHRGPSTYYLAIFREIDQMFALCLLDVGGMLVLAVVLFLFRRTAYTHIKYPPVWRFTRSELFHQQTRFPRQA